MIFSAEEEHYLYDDMKLAIKTTDIEATITSLKAIDEALINDLDSKYISSTGVVVRYEKLSTRGDYAPDNGIGYWVKNKSNPFYLVENTYDFGANNATDKSQNLILIRDYVENMCSDFLQFAAFVTEQLNTKTWAGCSNDEKMFLIDCYIKETGTTADNDLSAKQTYLIDEQGMTSQSALEYLGSRFSEFNDKQKDSCRQRIESKDLCISISKYLSVIDVRMLTEKVKDEYSYFHNYGYRDLIHFIESSNGRESDGLEQQGYTLKIGSIDDLKNELLGILKLGIYS